MKKNNKGYTLVEVVVSFSLIMIVMIYLLRTIIVIGQKNGELILLQQYNVLENTILSKVYKDLDSIGSLTLIEDASTNTITFNEVNKSLVVDVDNKSLIYDDVIYEIPEGITFDTNPYNLVNLTEEKYTIINVNLKLNNKSKVLQIAHTINKVESNRLICKKATKLHTEICTTGSCTSSGYTEDGSKGTTTITYGNLGTSGQLNVGDAFDCDVNGDGVYSATTERFYYVNNYYNTNTNSYEDDTAVLLYYTNVSKATGKLKRYVENTTTSPYNNKDYNHYGGNDAGPDDAITYLPTVNEWKNVRLKYNVRKILNENSEPKVTYSSTVYSLPTAFRYNGLAARLLTTQEIGPACNVIIQDGLTIPTPDSCEFLYEKTRYTTNNSRLTRGYYMETRSSTSWLYAWVVESFPRIYDQTIDYGSEFGVRPVIEVPKTNMQY